jgi:hypothetical protein
MNREDAMRPTFPTRETQILEKALALLHRTTGLKGQVTAYEPNHALVEITTADREYEFVAEVKNARHFATIALTREHLVHAKPGVQPLLVAPYITRALAERCRELHLPFLDTAGNAYLEAPGLMVYITGEPRPAEIGDNARYKAFTATGMKVIFVMLCQPALAVATYREIALAADVALGAVGPIVDDLKIRGFLVPREGKNTLTNQRKLAEEWVARFADTLRPKLFENRYQADPKRLRAVNLLLHHAYWGGEVAGERLTGYLKPEQFTLYFATNEKQFITRARMRLDPNGNTEILRAFWNLPDNEKYLNIVPPLLAYADLMATGEGRNLETARLIYDKFLEPVYGR